jgi:hypothetical protein
LETLCVEKFAYSSLLRNGLNKGKGYKKYRYIADFRKEVPPKSLDFRSRDVSRTQLWCKLGYERLVLCICVLSMTRRAATPTASVEQKGTNANKKSRDFVSKVAEQAYVRPVCVLSAFCLSRKLGGTSFSKNAIN